MSACMHSRGSTIVKTLAIHFLQWHQRERQRMSLLRVRAAANQWQKQNLCSVNYADFGLTRCPFCKKEFVLTAKKHDGNAGVAKMCITRSSQAYALIVRRVLAVEF